MRNKIALLVSILMIVSLSSSVFAKEVEVKVPTTVKIDDQHVKTIGLLQGGGSLIGVDFENMTVCK